MKTDTIAAIATGMSSSGISIIRISGDEAVEIADRIFNGKKQGFHLKNAKTHTIHYGNITDEKGNVLDEVLVSVMLAPKSYTAEDVVEINCHGGILITNQILERVLQAGARLAQPGEFTKRAFLNGRIDLSEAEAVMDLIDAKSRAAVKNSEKHLQGILRTKITSLREDILHETAYIEAALDDPEHFDLTGYPDILLDIVQKMLAEVNTLLVSADEGELLKNGIRTVILGKPNVGKSTFMNLLLGQDKAIVTEIAGTTRDILEESLTIRGIPFCFLDTAGIRETEDVVERIGVKRAIDAAEDADLVLYLADCTSEFDEEDIKILSGIRDKRVIILLNKTDLQPVTDAKQIQRMLQTFLFQNEDQDVRSEPYIRILTISARFEQGIEEFKDVVCSLFFNGHLPDEDALYITNMRHKEALLQTKASFENVLKSIENEMPEDFYSIDLMDAYEALGRITGDQIEDDLVEKIFSEFCMGK